METTGPTWSGTTARTSRWEESRAGWDSAQGRARLQERACWPERACWDTSLGHRQVRSRVAGRVHVQDLVVTAGRGSSWMARLGGRHWQALRQQEDYGDPSPRVAHYHRQPPCHHAPAQAPGHPAQRHHPLARLLQRWYRRTSHRLDRGPEVRPRRRSRCWGPGGSGASAVGTPQSHRPLCLEGSLADARRCPRPHALLYLVPLVLWTAWDHIPHHHHLT